MCAMMSQCFGKTVLQQCVAKIVCCVECIAMTAYCTECAVRIVRSTQCVAMFVSYTVRIYI